ncbi:MAG: IPT/TIG domain-containing protein [Ignavibacteriales bacterium]|nr:IPT/TIG domain-containing protein [Ignavibacteriales bacterium]
MRTFLQTTLLFVILVLGLVLVSGCENPKTGSLYDATATSLPQPTITSVSPTGSAFAGMDTIVITGTNFSTALGDNSVLFNVTSAALLKTTATQITLKAPLVALDSVAIRVSVFGSPLFSNTYQYKLLAGMAKFGTFIATETATSLAIDATGNLYSGFSSNGLEAGVAKFTAAGTRSVYAPSTAGVAIWSGLKFGPGGFLYAARNARAMYRFPANGGGSGAVYQALPVGVFAYDFDFDQSGMMWIGGNNSSIYRLDPNKVLTTFPFVGQIRSVRVYNGYLYFSAKTDAGEKVWRAQISTSSLGTPEVYFDFGAVYPTNIANCITFSSDGILYIGTDSPDGILVVNPDKSYSAPFSAYSALYTSSISFLTWGAGNDMYASSSAGVLMKVTVRGKKSAPYYGTTM